MSVAQTPAMGSRWIDTPSSSADQRRVEAQRARGYPISRWYLRPLAGFVAGLLTGSSLRPGHVTCAGLGFAGGSAVAVMLWPAGSAWAAALLLAAWFCDRLDGQLARRQGTATEWGSWFDANTDELIDLAWHVAAAYACVASGASYAWPALVAFLIGKHLFMHGLTGDQIPASLGASASPRGPSRWPRLRSAYQFLGVADVRLHLMVLAAWSGQWLAELILIGAYYNVRWAARFPLVYRRLGGSEA